MAKTNSVLASLSSSLRSHAFALGLVCALACANANVTGDAHGNPNQQATDGNEPLSTGDGNQPVTTPVDGNGMPQVGNIGLRYIGRANSGNVLSWSGSSLELYFSGTDATFQFQAPTNPVSYLGISVNGVFQGNVPIPNGQPIALGPYPNGNQVIRLTKLNEAKLGEVGLQSWNANGSLNVPHFASRRIEVIGDSIAGAYGSEGTDANCVNTSASENALAAFPALLGNTFQADVSVISYAGRGVLRNDVSDPNTLLPVMPRLWTRTIASGADNSYTYSPGSIPDVFVVMLGTNDYEYASSSNGNVTPVRSVLDRGQFVTKYQTFVQSLLSACPNAAVVLCGSPLLSDSYPSSTDMQHTSLATDLNNVVSAIGQPQQVVALDIPTLLNSQRTGCGGHPNHLGHQQIATAIAQALRNLLGW